MRAKLLDVAPALARRLPREQIAEATKSLVVRTIELPAGPWQAPSETEVNHLGFLLLEGNLMREVSIGPDWSAELLGVGDLLRPWVEDAASFAESRWRVLHRARLAVLDGRAATRLRGYPALVDELIERALWRSRSLAVHAVIEGVHRIDERLLLLFWYLAEQHGRRSGDEIIVPIELTHDDLSKLVGARRPTVTSALATLEQAGDVRRTDAGWVVTGDPPPPGGGRSGSA